MHAFLFPYQTRPVSAATRASATGKESTDFLKTQRTLDSQLLCTAARTGLFLEFIVRLDHSSKITAAFPAYTSVV